MKREAGRYSLAVGCFAQSCKINFAKEIEFSNSIWLQEVSQYTKADEEHLSFYTALLLACLKPKLITKQVPFCAPGLCPGFPRVTYPSSSQRISPSDASRFKVLRTGTQLW